VAKLIALLGDYFTRMSDLVMHHDGIIDKYIGDCIMAVWGAPFPIDEPEVRASACAVMLLHETQVDPLRGAFEACGEVLGVRIGVHCGEVLAGNMGSSERMSYTVIGDPVNLAARLESLNKQYGTRVMVSGSVAEHLRGQFVLRLLALVNVVGKDVPVEVFEVLGAVSCPSYIRSVESPSVTPNVTRLLQETRVAASVSTVTALFAEQYTMAVRLFVLGNFVQAAQALEMIQQPPGTSSTALDDLLSNCLNNITNPPTKWSGVTQALQK